MLRTRRYRVASAMKWIARVIATSGALGFLLVFIGEAVSCEPKPFSWEGATVFAIGLGAIGGAILVWRREHLAHFAMFALSVALGAHIAICAGRYHLLVWTAVGLPYLVAGLLLMASLRLRRSKLEDS